MSLLDFEIKSQWSKVMYSSQRDQMWSEIYFWVHFVTDIK